mgnify:CR=1 FL=1|tara:strand:- start:13826 stop:15331 length:1506 start_codon:yes stop_codon:yes gene_type:complete
MTLPRFDRGSSFEKQFPDEVIDGLGPRLESLRARLTQLANPIRDSSAIDLSEGMTSVDSPSDDRSFFRLPERQYAAYVARREASDLGRVFAVANGLHDHVDAVVVCSDPGMAAGARALMQACCDPYHNERTRAMRGSKPRMYFQPNPHENDALASLLTRLRQPHAEQTCEQRWAIVSLEPGDDLGRSTSHTDADQAQRGRQYLVDQLRQTLDQASPHSNLDPALADFPLADPARAEKTQPEQADVKQAGIEQDLARFVVSIGGSKSIASLSHVGGANGMPPARQRFSLTPDLGPAWTVLSPAGMLPAAMLGLDCMKLLEGAVVINDHFQDTPLADNIAMRLAASNYLAARGGLRHRLISTWSNALAGFGDWCGRLTQDSAATDATTTVLVNPSELERFRALCRVADGNRLVQHLVAQKSKCDAILGADSRSMDAMMQATYRQTLDEIESPSFSLTLSHIDTFTLGQLFQLTMIATWIEKELRCQDECGKTESMPDQQTGPT